MMFSVEYRGKRRNINVENMSKSSILSFYFL